MSKARLRRSRKSAASRLRPFWIVILLLLIAGSLAGYYGAGWPGFHLQRLTVQGEHVVARAQIVQRAAIDARTNLWLQDMRAAAARVRSIPYIDEAHIRRGLPATVAITVTERKPSAVVRAGAEPAKVIDAQLRVLEIGSSRHDLPRLRCVLRPQPRPGEFLRDDCVRALLRDYDTLAKAHVDAQSLERDGLGDVSALIVPGITVKLGDDTDLEAKGALIEPILSQTQAQGRRVRAVDLRAPKTPVVVFK